MRQRVRWGVEFTMLLIAMVSSVPVARDVSVKYSCCDIQLVLAAAVVAAIFVEVQIYNFDESLRQTIAAVFESEDRNSNMIFLETHVTTGLVFVCGLIAIFSLVTLMGSLYENGSNVATCLVRKDMVRW